MTAATAATVAPAFALLTRSTAASPAGCTVIAPGPAADDAPYIFFDAAEAQFIEAACARLIPADTAGPGALGAEVPRYLDRQLGSAWGAGERLYRSGPWQPGTPPMRVPLPFTPARLFRTALRSINLKFAERGANFAELPATSQDAFLAELASGGGAELGGVATAAFFDMLLTMTAEGFFSHPQYGGTRDRVAWRMIGFPGAHGAAAPRIAGRL